MIEILLGVSVVINGFFVWYIVQLLKRFLTFQDELDSFTERLEEYEKHVDVVYNLETFYGDSTLSNLLSHSKDIVTECKQFKALVLEEEDYEEEEEYAEEAQ